MPAWVCLLRGVNLGKQRKLPMAALRGALTTAGMTDVRTYLQSGNVIAHYPLGSHEQVSALVRTVIASEFSLAVPVITRLSAEIGEVIASNPFGARAAQRPHLVRVIFLSAVPAAASIDRLMSVEVLQDTCRVVGNHVYVDYVRGYHNTHRTAPYFTRVLGVEGTERNWRTVLALSDLCAQAASRTLGEAK